MEKASEALQYQLRGRGNLVIERENITQTALHIIAITGASLSVKMILPWLGFPRANLLVSERSLRRKPTALTYNLISSLLVMTYQMCSPIPISPSQILALLDSCIAGRKGSIIEVCLLRFLRTAAVVVSTLSGPSVCRHLSARVIYVTNHAVKNRLLYIVGVRWFGTSGRSSPSQSAHFNNILPQVKELSLTVDVSAYDNSALNRG